MKIIVTIIGILIMTTASAQTNRYGNAKRISKTATIIVNTTVENAFPLFGPVKEKEWADGWNPEIIFSNESLVEEHMIFKTKSSNNYEKYFTWIVTQYDANDHVIEYTVSTENRIWFIRVVCKAVAEKTNVTVTYTYTGLTPLGTTLNEEALKKMYARNLKDWEEAINYYLETGAQFRE